MARPSWGDTHARHLGWPHADGAAVNAISCLADRILRHARRVLKLAAQPYGAWALHGVWLGGWPVPGCRMWHTERETARVPCCSRELVIAPTPMRPARLVSQRHGRMTTTRPGKRRAARIDLRCCVQNCTHVGSTRNARAAYHATHANSKPLVELACNEDGDLSRDRGCPVTVAARLKGSLPGHQWSKRSLAGHQLSRCPGVRALPAHQL